LLCATAVSSDGDRTGTDSECAKRFDKCEDYVDVIMFANDSTLATHKFYGSDTRNPNPHDCPTIGDIQACVENGGKCQGIGEDAKAIAKAVTYACKDTSRTCIQTKVPDSDCSDEDTAYVAANERWLTCTKCESVCKDWLADVNCNVASAQKYCGDEGSKLQKKYSAIEFGNTATQLQTMAPEDGSQCDQLLQFILKHK